MELKKEMLQELELSKIQNIVSNLEENSSFPLDIQEFTKDELIEIFLNTSYLNDLKIEDRKKLVSEAYHITSFGLCIREIRKKKNLTQKELAAKTGISESTIYNYENGRSKANAKNINNILKTLLFSYYSVDYFELDVKSYAQDIKKKELINENDELITENILLNIQNNKSNLYNDILKHIITDILDNKYIEPSKIINVISSLKMLQVNSLYKVGLTETNNENSKKSIFLVKGYGDDLKTIFFDTETFVKRILLSIDIEIENIFEKEYEIKDTEIEKFERYSRLENIKDKLEKKGFFEKKENFNIKIKTKTTYKNKKEIEKNLKDSVYKSALLKILKYSNTNIKDTDILSKGEENE